ncbi:MAG: hypothetical protein ABJ275_04320 [Maricaulaceae bacterium]
MAGAKSNEKINHSLSPRRDLKIVSQDLSRLNRELATQMIILASQTGDVDALIQSAEMLRKSQVQYGTENTSQETAEAHMILASTLHKIAKVNQDAGILEQAISEYRLAITLASVTNHEALRIRLRQDYKSARELARDLATNASHKHSA